MTEHVKAITGTTIKGADGQRYKLAEDVEFTGELVEQRKQTNPLAPYVCADAACLAVQFAEEQKLIVWRTSATPKRIPACAYCGEPLQTGEAYGRAVEAAEKAGFVRRGRKPKL
jgi:hypothetical protein